MTFQVVVHSKPIWGSQATTPQFSRRVPKEQPEECAIGIDASRGNRIGCSGRPPRRLGRWPSSCAAACRFGSDAGLSAPGALMASRQLSWAIAMPIGSRSYRQRPIRPMCLASLMGCPLPPNSRSRRFAAPYGPCRKADGSPSRKEICAQTSPDSLSRENPQASAAQPCLRPRGILPG